ncbi:hypothetical protein SOM61_16270 [Massilia sp. CFBP9012]|uniref:hypothetical protein n=1 Tax=Massilia sp. CFBP9012 TaxID=3096531 RepID=UPI002A6A3189|nr:hypothetical protein [Massilia sp. CFBP9012]MDY0976530.1 hypothetical protein [Massilia sp. CFBP9012]
MSMRRVLFIVTDTHEIGPHKRLAGDFFPEIAHPVEVFERHRGGARIPRRQLRWRKKS